MNNLLPVLPSAFSDEKVAERTTASKTWLPSRADPGDDKNIPFGLDAAFTKGTDGKGTRYLTSMPPVLDPNHRNLEVVYRFDDPSPLSSSERGISPETSHIAMPKEQGMLRQSAPSRGKKYADGDEPLLLQVNNLLEGDLEVYIQRASAMQLSVLRPNMKCERCLTDTKGLPSHKKDGKEYPPLAVLFSTVLKISAVITGRHEVRAFHFAPGQIGIEVEMLYQRLICTRVVPGSQAHIHEEALNGSEILSVNGARVVSLDQFQHTVLAAYESGSVVIGAAAYKTTAEHTKHKKDFAHFIGSTKVEFKSLLSNMMRSGLDKDHQHDIGPGKHGDDDDDDDDDSSSSSSSSSASTGSPRPSGDAEAKPQMDGCAQPDRDADEEADGAGGEEDDPEEDERRHNSDSDSDEDNKISIRKAPQQAKRVYAGNEDGDEGGMLVAGRNTKDHMDALYSPRDDDKIQPVDPADVLEVETGGDDNEQEAILVVTEAKPPVLTHETKETWDYTTALELEEAIPYSTLVCVPRHFQKSLGWGDPQKCVQFTNYSAKWDIQICWVDVESAVVPRCRLRSGQKHIELTSPKHVWIIIATLADKKVGRPGTEEHGHHLDSSVQGTAMILRPSVQALGTRKYTSAMWIPGQSITATQRLRAKVPPTHKLRPDSVPKEYEVLPNLMVSVLDGAARK